MIYKECRKYNFSFPFAVLLGVALIFSLAGCSSEAAKQKHLARGEEYLQKRKYREAEMEFKAASDIDKNSPEAHWGLARALENQGKFYETIDELRRVIELAPQNLDAKAKLGNYFLLAQPPQIEDTQKLLDEIFAVNPNFIEGLILKASLLSVQNKPENEITDVLNHAISLEPNRIDSYLSLAHFYMKIDKGAEAEQTIQKAISVNDKSALGYVEYGRFLTYAGRPVEEAEAQFKKAVEVEPKNLDARQAIADFYLAQKQFDKAEQAYKDLAAAQDNSPEGRTALADFYAATGRADEAIQVFEGILKDAPETASARYRLGEIYLERKDTAKVLEQAEALLAVNDSDAQALLLRARVKLQDNSPEQAIKDLEEILKKQPSLKSALFYMAQARLALGQVDEARAFIGDLEKYHPGYLNSKLLQIQASFTANNSEKALQQANQLVEMAKDASPNAEMNSGELEELRIRALVARGTANLNLNKLPGARADFEAVQKLAPNSSNAYVNLARVASAAGNQEEALGFYQKAISLDGKNFDAFSGTINLLKQQKQYAEAHAQIDQAIKNSSLKDTAALHYLKSDIFQAEKNYSSAESELTAAIESDSNYLPAYSSYAGLLVGQNQIDRAIGQYQKIIEKRQSSPIYTLLGILEDSRGNYDESEKYYRKALEITPDSAIAANNLAWNIAAYNRGNLDEALRLAQANVSKNLNNASFYDTLGWVYFKKGLNTQAIEQMKKAVAADMSDAARSGKPENPGYRLRLGQTLASAGDKSGARREVEVALQNQKDLSASEIQDARVLLAGL